MKKEKLILRIQKNLAKNMIAYTFLAIIFGLVLGLFWNLKSLSNIIIPVVFIMIYPMMVNLSLASLKKIKGSTKPLSEALIINFIVAPLLMWLLVSIFVNNPQMELALMLLAIAPASSMGLGYIGLAEGHLLSGAIIVASAFLASIFFYPFLGHYFAQGVNIIVPTVLILKNLIIILVFPLLLGVATREYLEHRRGVQGFLKVKPYFSATTLFFLYILIFIIFASKASLIIKNVHSILILIPIAILYYGISILLTLVVNKKILKLEYGHHQAVVFTSVSKNIALTIAILVSAFGKEGQYLAVFPAIMSLFQAPFLMLYLKNSSKIKKYFGVV